MCLNHRFKRIRTLGSLPSSTQANLRDLKLKENVFIDKQGNEIGLLLETMKLDKEVKDYFPKSYKYSIGIQSLIKSPEQEKEFFKEFEYAAKNKNGIFCLVNRKYCDRFYNSHD